MAHDNYPRGAGLGRDTNRKQPGLIDYEWTMQHGSRAQRREIVRLLKMHKRQGNAEAGAVLEDFSARHSAPWLAFTLGSSQQATADEIPGSGGGVHE